MSGKVVEQSEEQQGTFPQTASVPQPVGSGRGLPSLLDRQPGVPLSPATGLVTSLKILVPAGQSTPVSSPVTISNQQSLEWENHQEDLVGDIGRVSVQRSLSGIERLTEEITRKVSATNPNLLDEESTY